MTKRRKVAKKTKPAARAVKVKATNFTTDFPGADVYTIAKKTKLATRAVKVKEVILPPDAVVRVVIPAGAMPVVATDPVKRTVEIVPVKKKESWWGSLFG